MKPLFVSDCSCCRRFLNSFNAFVTIKFPGFTLEITASKKFFIRQQLK